MNIDPDLIPVISILAMALVSGIVAWRKGGDIQAGATKSTYGIIGNETLSTTVETRLSAIPQDKRDFVLQFIDMVTPITDTNVVSKDAAQWMKNMLDGNPQTGAITFTAPLDAIGKSGSIHVSTGSDNTGIAG
jgi:hypothetical protein